MRRKPAAFALIDVAALADPKWRAVARRLTDLDDFNSAFGAWVIALLAARRNGLPTIDLAAETGSSFLDDLIACRLLTPDGFNEAAFREWAPRRPVYASDAAPNAPNAPSSPNTPASKSSTPLLYRESGTETEEVRTRASSVPRRNGHPEDEVIDWLAKQGAYLPPTGGGLHQKLATLVGQHTAQDVIAAMEALGHQNEARQYVFGAANALNPIPKPVPAKEEDEVPDVVAYLRAKRANGGAT